METVGAIGASAIVVAGAISRKVATRGGWLRSPLLIVIRLQHVTAVWFKMTLHALFVIRWQLACITLHECELNKEGKGWGGISVILLSSCPYLGRETISILRWLLRLILLRVVATSGGRMRRSDHWSRLTLACPSAARAQ